jgi:diguanylate cyclase (GGDEF)-like protein/PAS domain S-box-containing protein
MQGAYRDMSIFDKLFSESRVTVPLIDYLHEGVVVLNREGTVVEANQSFARLVDLKKEVMIGKDCRSIAPLAPLWNTVTYTLVQKAERMDRLDYKGNVYEANFVPISMDGEGLFVCIIFRDISANIALEAELLKRNKELLITNSLSSTFISAAHMETIVTELLDKVLLITGLNLGWVMLTSGEGGTEFQLAGRSGISQEFMGVLQGRELDEFYRRVLHDGDPMVIVEEGGPGYLDAFRREGIMILVAMPLKTADRDSGVLVVASRMHVGFDFDLASLLSIIGNHLSLIFEKVSLFEETRRLSITDALTGLHNIRYFYEELEHEVDRTERYGTAFSLVLFDIDDFKKLNDTFGHQAGDEVLKAFSDVMRHASRKADTAARYGGEEFILILPETSKKKAHALAVRIKDLLEEKRYITGSDMRITVSGGVATFPEDATDAKGLLYAADMAMYRAKITGKNRVVSYSDEHHGPTPPARP